MRYHIIYLIKIYKSYNIVIWELDEDTACAGKEAQPGQTCKLS